MIVIQPPMDEIRSLFAEKSPSARQNGRYLLRSADRQYTSNLAPKICVQSLTGCALGSWHRSLSITPAGTSD
jgi:hypothetical protein